MSMKIKKDDQVMVIAGKDKGHVGRVVRVIPEKGRIMVDGAAVAKRHMRAGGKRAKDGQQLQQGGIIDMETAIDISNVALVCPACGKPTRIGSEGEGKARTRVCRKCGAQL